MKGLNFLPTCNKVDVTRLKLELEQFGRMLRLKWYFKEAVAQRCSVKKLFYSLQLY